LDAGGETSSDAWQITGARPDESHETPRGDLNTIVQTALAPEPARRYGSVEKLGDDVRNYLAGRPIAARPATFVYRHAASEARCGAALR